MLAVALTPLLGLAVMVLVPSRPPAPPREKSPWTDDVGATVTLAKAPRRMVSLAPSLTEMVYALGAGDRLVGRTRFDAHPPEAQDLPTVGGLADVNLEAVVALKPDLVLATDLTPPGVAERLAGLGIPTVTFRHESLEDTLDDMESLAGLIGVDARGRAEIARLRAVCELSAATPDEQSPRVLVLLGLADLYSPGPGTYAYGVVAHTGARQATDGMATGWPLLTMERVLAFDPQIILVALADGMAEPGKIREAWERMRADSRWANVSAVRDNRLVLVGGNLLTVPGPRLDEAIRQVAAGVHGETSAPAPSGRPDTVASGEKP